MKKYFILILLTSVLMLFLFKVSLLTSPSHAVYSPIVNHEIIDPVMANPNYIDNIIHPVFFDYTCIKYLIPIAEKSRPVEAILIAQRFPPDTISDRNYYTFDIPNFNITYYHLLYNLLIDTMLYPINNNHKSVTPETAVIKWSINHVVYLSGINFNFNDYIV